MKIGIWFIILLCLLIGTVTALANNIILAPANIDTAPIQKLNSSTIETSLEFRMAGIEDKDTVVAGVTAKKVAPLTSSPDNFGEISEVGHPDLPLYSQLVAIPDQAGVTVEIISSSYQILENYDIMPTQPSVAEHDMVELPFSKDEQLYQKNEFYPPEIVQLGEPVIMRDLRMIQTNINPVQYNPVTKQLKVYTDIQYRLNYSGTDTRNMKIRRNNQISEAFLPLYHSLVPNADEMLAAYEPVKGGYVIITKPTLADSLRALALWKHQKGYISRIVSTTEITPSGSPSYTQIFNYLRTAYQTWDVPPEYVMIVGDIDGSFAIPDYPYQGFPSDHQYACVDGTDYLPDIFVARLSVDNILEFRVAVSKIFKYEKTPLMRDPQHWIRGLSVGYTYYNTARYTTLWVRQLALEHGFFRVDTVYSQSHDSHVATYMNSGPGMIWYRGAGGSDGWAGPDYSISDLNAMPNNQKLGVMTPLTCGLGDFSAECFGETWIRMGMNPDSLKGGPAFFGVSDHNTHTKWNNPIMVGYFNGLFNSGIYHFAAAAVAGKMQDYRTFPGNPSGYVQQYFNTYNMLGDPELEIRSAIPKSIIVDYPHSIPFGTGYIHARVADTLGNPIEGATATIIKGRAPNEEVFKVDKSDLDGNVDFTFEANSPDTIFITVSGRDLIPCLGYILMYQPTIAVGFDSLYIDNSDHLLSPNESAPLEVILRNFGTNQTDGIRAALDPLDTDIVTINEGAHYYGTILPGQQGSSTPFNIYIKPTAVDGSIARVRIAATDAYGNQWDSGLDLTVSAPKLIVNGTSLPGGNSRLDPGDTCNLIVTLSNQGNLPAQNVTAILSSDDPYLTIINPNGTYGTIAVGGSGPNSTPMVIALSGEAFNGRLVNLLLHTVTSDGMESDIPFSIAVGSVATTDPTGPDRYGYYIYDNTDVSDSLHPTYSWIELAPGLGGQGTRLNYGGGTDDKSVLVTLPFNFIYYGQSYTNIIVCTNGFIAPDTTRMDMGGNYWANFFNWPIPDPGNAKAQISPFWDDLQVNSTGNNGVFVWNDSTNHRYIIEWSGTTHRNTGSVETFEMVIYNSAFYPTITGDAEMLFQYNTIANNDVDENYSTVGFEDWSETDGIQYTFDNIYGPGAASLGNGRAIKITTNDGRGSIGGVADLTDTVSDIGVKVTSSNGRYTTTPASGRYLIADLVPGAYDLTANKKGYFGATISAVQVNANQATQGANFSLTPCPTPSNLTASVGFTGRIELAWTGVSHQDFVGYDLYRGPWENGEYQKLNTTPITVTNYTDSPISDSSYYWYYVVATYAGTGWTAESMPSNKNDGTTGAPAGALAGRVTESDGSTPISGVLVKALNGIVEIRRDTTDGSGQYMLANLPPIVVNLEASKDTYDTRTQYDVQIVSAETTLVNLILMPQGTSSCQYVVGDANGNNSFNGLDVTYSVSYFKGGNPPPYSCECTPGHVWFVAGDVNGSCNFNGLDVTYMVSYFKGGPGPYPCPDCQPGGLLAPIPGVQPVLMPGLNSVPEKGKAE